VIELAWGAMDTPVGVLSVACTASGVAKLRYGSPPDPLPPDPGGTARELVATALAELREYFAGRRTSFSVPVDLSATSGSRHTVLSVLYESVAFGQTLTYGGLAARAGLTGDGQTPPARVVGQIMATNPVAVIVPCHRVVAGNGIGGYSGGTGTDVKQWLLIFEGALPATLDWDPAGMPRVQSAGPA
jgi:methylated-DNA-[protein]-cysteine S-methyltransferase